MFIVTAADHPISDLRIFQFRTEKRSWHFRDEVISSNGKLRVCLEMEVEQIVERAHAAKQAKLTPSPEFTVPRLLERHGRKLPAASNFRYEDTVGTVVTVGDARG